MKQIKARLVLGFAQLLRVPIRLSIEKYWWMVPTEESGDHQSGRPQRHSARMYSNQRREEAG